MAELPRTRGGRLPARGLRQGQRRRALGRHAVHGRPVPRRARRATGRPELVDEAERQFLVHARYLADRETGLWFHGWTFAGRHNFARARWARGNAWAIAGLLDYLDIADRPAAASATVPARLPPPPGRGAARPAGRARRLAHPARRPELLSRGDLGTRRHRLRPAEAAPARPLGEAHRAAGLGAGLRSLANIDADGTLQNVSYGTRMGHDLQFYRDIPIQPTGYGQALAHPPA